MLLTGTMKAMPVPGTSICSLRRRPFWSLGQVSAVIMAKRTAFSVFSRPRVESVSCTAVPEPTVRRLTVTPNSAYRARKASVERRSVMVTSQ